MILNDQQIRARCEWTDHPPMISPYTYAQCRAVTMVDTPSPAISTSRTIPVISHGQSSYGYDITLASTGLQRFRHPLIDVTVNPQTGVIDYIAPIIVDPKNFDSQTSIPLASMFDESGRFYILPPRAYALGVSVETFNIPVNVLGICYCKSTYARCGLIVNTTPLEPGWRGQLVIELANLTDLPLKVYANEGIAQVVFFEGDPPSITYADRAGKYQDQKGIVTARI